jgi:hypothetical protein
VTEAVAERRCAHDAALPSSEDSSIPTASANRKVSRWSRTAAVRKISTHGLLVLMTVLTKPADATCDGAARHRSRCPTGPEEDPNSATFADRQSSVPPARMAPVETARGPDTIRGWDDERSPSGWATEHALGVDVRFPLPGYGVGAALRSGVHRVRSYSKRGLFSESGEKFNYDLGTDAASWCAPILCFGFGVFFMPEDALFGNELGADLELTAHALDEGAEKDSWSVAAYVRPSLRVSRGRWRSQSLFGALAPDVGGWFRDHRGGIGLGWSVYPLGFHLHDRYALEPEPLRIGLEIPFDGARAEVVPRATLSVVLLR